MGSNPGHSTVFFLLAFFFHFLLLLLHFLHHGSIRRILIPRNFTFIEMEFWQFPQKLYKFTFIKISLTPKILHKFFENFDECEQNIWMNVKTRFDESEIPGNRAMTFENKSKFLSLRAEFYAQICLMRLKIFVQKWLN